MTYIFYKRKRYSTTNVCLKNGLSILLLCKYSKQDDLSVFFFGNVVDKTVPSHTCRLRQFFVGGWEWWGGGRGWGDSSEGLGRGRGGGGGG